MRPSLTSTDPVAISITRAIHTGDVAVLRQLLSDDPGLADARIVGANGVKRSMVHVVTDWPGRFPNVAATLRALALAGADVNARMSPHPKDPNCVETPLHWAASSSNDVVAIDAGTRRRRCRPQRAVAMLGSYRGFGAASEPPDLGDLTPS